jgi:hypothetical protein
VSKREIEVVIRGAVGSGTHSAAHAAARALQAAGASVDLRTPVTQDELSDEALYAVHALVRVEEKTASARAMPEMAQKSGPAQASKIWIGVVMLLMLFGAELRLNFGLRFDMIVTLIAVWIFWRYCFKHQVALI